jgi:uncharacterized membrane protein
MKPAYPVTLSSLLLFMVFLTIQACVSDPDLENYPVVSFKNEVQPIIAGNCNQTGCHGGVNTEEFNLVTYDDVKIHVTPGNARKSNLYKVITGRSEEFMPPSPSNPLTEEQIRTIFVWIEQGATNN